jgi:hypothetical protein
MSKKKPAKSRTAPDAALEQRRWVILYFAMAIVMPVLYVLVTGHVWEDFLITFRHSKNLVDGNGLVFNPGQRVQGFTSVLNVMLPALFYAVCGHSMEAALNLYRAVCLGVYVWGGFELLKLLLRNPGIDRYSPLVFILLYTTSAKMVSFTMNGQEAAFMIGFLSVGMASAFEGMGKCWRMLAVSWTGLLYTRPDAPLYVAALAVVGLIFATENKKEALLGIARAAGVAAILFLPWFLWAWNYYGNPFPNTMLAKSELRHDQLLDPAGLLRSVMEIFPLISAWVFDPIYASVGGWPRSALDSYDLICSIVCVGYWMIPSSDRLGRMASLLFTLCTLHLSLISVSSSARPWYLPAAEVIGTFVLARAVVEMMRRIPGLDKPPYTSARVVQAGIVACSTLLMLGEVVEIRIQQREIEDNGRMQIGLYLHQVMKPDQRAYMEPIGYIGYYSDRFILDWPGLVTPEIVKLHHAGLDQGQIVGALKPEWLVLRPSEIGPVQKLPGGVWDDYVEVKPFDANARLDQYGYIPGEGFLRGDAVFYVFCRKDVIPAAVVP